MATDAFTPRWAGGWVLARVLFGIAAADAQIARIVDVRDALASPTLSFGSGPTRITDHVLLPAPAAWVLWASAFVGVAGILAGGRWAKPGVLAWFVTHAALLLLLGLDVRAPERFIVWVVIGLLFSPIAETGLANKWRSPAPRWYFLLIYCALYGSTGWMKATLEPAWWTGEALRYDLVDRFHAGGALDAWLSGQHWATLGMSWYTILFEAGFPLLVWFPAVHPWILIFGIGMHVGIGTLMDVGPLGTMAMAMYPVVCDPDRAHALWRRVEPTLSRLRRAR